MRQPLEYPERKEETAKSQTYAYDFFYVHKHLEIVEFVGVVHINVLISFEEDLDVFCNNEDKHAAQISNFTKVCNSANTQ